jgi:hypothetical protein
VLTSAHAADAIEQRYGAHPGARRLHRRVHRARRRPGPGDSVSGLEMTRETRGDIVVFDPARVPHGIELSDDSILRARSRLYSVSVERRAGAPRPAGLDGT